MKKNLFVQYQEQPTPFPASEMVYAAKKVGDVSNNYPTNRSAAYIVDSRAYITYSILLVYVIGSQKPLIYEKFVPKKVPKICPKFNADSFKN